jgi:hypothetical protein
VTKTGWDLPRASKLTRTEDSVLSVSSTLDHQINQAAFWATVIALGTGAIQFFLPLAAPGGYEATTSGRVAWLATNSGSFIIGWVNQIVLMISLSGILAGVAWQIAGNHPLRAILAATLVVISMAAFFIPKFIAVWTIPMLAEAIATGSSAASDMAEGLLPILNVSVPFSLYTSFDYLGFWLYSLVALLVARPLVSGELSAKIVGITLGVFGLAYNGVVVAILARAIERPLIETYVVGVSGLLVIVMISGLFLFGGATTGREA